MHFRIKVGSELAHELFPLQSMYGQKMPRVKPRNIYSKQWHRMIKRKRSPEDIYFSFIDLSIFMEMKTIASFCTPSSLSIR